jgi:hypothetical protein
LDGVAPKCNFICNIPYKYWKIHLMAIQCSMLRLAVCWLNTLIKYAKLGRVHNMAYIKDPIACWYGNPFDSSFPFTFLYNFTLRLNGTLMGLHSSIQKRFNISLRYLIWLMHRSCWSWFLFTSISKKNVTPLGLSFQTYDLIPLWFVKVCFDRCTPKWCHPHRPQWKTPHLPLLQHTIGNNLKTNKKWKF